jgi:mono/diheme cytochrome c family protein
MAPPDEEQNGAEPNQTGLSGGMFLAAMGGLLAFTLVVLVGAAILGAAFGPDDDGGTDSADEVAEDSVDSDQVAAGEALFASTCASCHGASGEGGVGPAFSGIVDRYPDVADHIQVVVEGQGSMPAFGVSLTSPEIEAVVAYEREALGG